MFHTVPEPGEFGADTWPEGALDDGGGVHNWSELTVDEARGIAYIPLGTARFDFYGGNRHGDNLFGNSLRRARRAHAASGCGTSRPSITISGTTTCRRRRSC